MANVMFREIPLFVAVAVVREACKALAYQCWVIIGSPEEPDTRTRDGVRRLKYPLPFTAQQMAMFRREGEREATFAEWQAAFGKMEEEWVRRVEWVRSQITAELVECFGEGTKLAAVNIGPEMDAKAILAVVEEIRGPGGPIAVFRNAVARATVQQSTPTPQPTVASPSQKEQTVGDAIASLRALTTQERLGDETLRDTATLEYQGLVKIVRGAALPSDHVIIVGWREAVAAYEKLWKEMAAGITPIKAVRS